jgi:hypothetical protein
MQVQGFVVEDARRFGIRRVVELEATIQGETIDEVAANASARSVCGFEYLNVDAVNRQFPSRGQTREPGTDDDDVMVRHRLGALECGAYR